MIEVNEHWTEDAFNIVVEHKKQENMRNFIAGQASGWQSVATLPAALAGGMVDPANLMSVAIPGLGGAMLAGILQRASGFMGRTGVRLTDGAIAGGLSALALEPIIMSGQKEIQADCALAQSLMRFGNSIIIGAVLRSGVGGLIEWRINRHNKNLIPGELPTPHPWEISMPTKESDMLRSKFARQMREAYIGANPEADTVAIGHEAEALAVAYDQHMRRIAYLENLPIKEIWGRNSPEILNGEAVSLLDDSLKGVELARAITKQRQRIIDLEAGLNLPETRGLKYGEIFPARHRGLRYGEPLIPRERGLRCGLTENERDRGLRYGAQNEAYASRQTKERNLSYCKLRLKCLLERERNESADVETLCSMYLARDATLEEFLSRAAEKRDAYWKFESNNSRPPIILGSTEAFHIKRRHPDFKLWKEFCKTIDEGSEAKSGKISRLTGGETWIYWRALGSGIYHVAVVSPVKSKKHGNYIRIITSYQTSRKGLESTLNKEAALYRSTGGSPAYPSPRVENYWRDVLPGLGSGEQNLPENPANVKPEVATGANKSGELTLFQSASREGGKARHERESGLIFGSATFKENRTIIRLFAGSDTETMAHETGHILRRQLEYFARKDGANPMLASQYESLEKAFGVVDGKWSVAQEEAFANAWKLYLNDGVSPMRLGRPAFDLMRDRLKDLFADADAARAKISKQVRDVFEFHFGITMAEAETNFLAALNAVERGDYDMVLYDPAHATEYSGLRYEGEIDSDLVAMETLSQDLGKEVEEVLAGMENSGNAESIRIAAIFRQELAEADAEVAKANNRAKFMEDYVSCKLRKAV